MHGLTLVARVRVTHPDEIVVNPLTVELQDGETKFLALLAGQVLKGPAHTRALTCMCESLK